MLRHDPSRRAFLAALAALAPMPAHAQAALLCPADPTISNPASPLTIDTHAHIFNGSDLQVKEFLSQTTVGPESELYPLVNAETPSASTTLGSIAVLLITLPSGARLPRGKLTVLVRPL